MDLVDLSRVNDLWRKIYPYLAAQAMEYYGRSHGDVLELGPFSGGMSLELSRLHPGLSVTLAAPDARVVDYLREEIERSGLDRKPEVIRSELGSLVFPDCQFDLVLFRGAYFFLDEEGGILREVYRVLKEGGLAFVGGGYGRNTPQALIDEIAEESRVLNDRLGRKRVTGDQVKIIVNKSGLTRRARIEQEGGLWLVIQK